MSAARQATMDYNLKTNRLEIRTFKESDISEEYLSWLNDQEVTRYSNQRFYEHDRKSCSQYQQSFKATSNSFLILVHKNDMRPIGTITIYRNLNHGTGDIGMMIGDKNYWRKGFGMEAWSAVLDSLLKEKGIRKVTGGTVRPNKGMIKIMEKSGMKLEAVRKNQEIVEGRSVDILHYAIFTG